MLFIIQFLHPEILYGLFFLIVPVILHLFSLKKYKKVYFSNFNFLLSLQQQRKNSSRLKKWLLLLLRLLTLACIVTAFAGPYLSPENKSTGTKNGSPVIIYTDNSFSMTNAGTQGSLLEEAKKYLLNIINNYPAGTTFRLLTNEQPDDAVLSKEQMYSVLSKITPGPSSRPLSQICTEAAELSNHQPHTLFIISDFQKINCDFRQVGQDSLQERVLLSLKPENRHNLSVRDVHFEQAFHKKNQTNKINITVANSSEKEFHHIPVTLTINGQKKSVSNIDIPAHAESSISINYLNPDEGFYKGTVEIADFPLVFDNQYFFSYETSKNSRILYLWQEAKNPCFSKLFSDTTTFDFVSQPASMAVQLNPGNYDLVILDGAGNSSSGFESLLEEYLVRGGNLLILPGSSATNIQNRFLQKIHAPQFMEADTNTNISFIETQSPLFRDVFEQDIKNARLPSIQLFYLLSSTENTEKILSDKRGHTLLSAKTFGKGNVYVSAFNYHPRNSDLAYHPLFVPLLVNMASHINAGLHGSYFLNSNQNVTLSNKNYKEGVPVKIRKEDGSFEFIPDIRKDFSGDIVITNAGIIREAGQYEVIQDGQVIDVLAWNYNRKESDMEYCSEEELKKYLPAARIENIRSAQPDHNNTLIREIVLQDNNKYLTVWFLLLTVICLLSEQIVWKKKLG